MSDSKQSKRHFLTLFTRCKDEPFIFEFVHHYLHEGVDRIYIFDHDSVLEYPDVLRQDPRVIIVEDERLNAKNPTQLTELIYALKIADTEWLIYVDVDEFISSPRHPGRTIREELQTTFRHADCVKVPWVMMSPNGRELNPKNLLNDIVHRWNHDLRHPTDNAHGKFRCRYDKIEVKSIFRPDRFSRLADHNPYEPKGEVSCVDSTVNRPAGLNPHHDNLRESDIKNAYLVCYHYRTYSVQSAGHKIRTNAYYRGYSVADLMSCDYPELVDETLRSKSRARREA